MDASLVKRLLELNRDFYARFGLAFADARSAARLNLEPFRRYLGNGIRLLDVGCGNGRLAEALERAGYTLAYVGIDQSSVLLEIARRQSRQLQSVHAQFYALDITASHWHEQLRDAAPFDLALALAVLHHIPSFELRAAVLREIHALLKPGGVLVMSNWQFLANERLRKKIVPWAQLGIEEDALEEGDALLDWKRGGLGYRYCHLLSEGEVERLARASSFQVVAQYYADGDLNLYSILLKIPGRTSRR